MCLHQGANLPSAKYHTTKIFEGGGGNLSRFGYYYMFDALVELRQVYRASRNNGLDLFDRFLFPNGKSETR
jgi:hypothetical protein